MTKLSVRPYIAEDFLDIELMDYEREYRVGQPVELWAQAKEKLGPAVTVSDPEGEIVFCLGVHNMWNMWDTPSGKVGEMWAVFSPLAKKYPHTLVVARDLLAILFKDYVRLQASLDPVNCPESIRLGERLGFKPEFLMRRYGPHGEDTMMYSLVREE